ncbi:hypothetical protein NIES3585_39290 [Nodularia sp. NIES-3585]|nr:hypothetical protein NIES3585_39290 [Nodularia sp. NIES-3585]
MAQYCQAGDTARVTFPDGEKRDYPAPIDMKCEDGLLSPPKLQVEITVSYRAKVFFNNGNSFYYVGGTNKTSNYSGYSAFSPVLGTRIISDSNGSHFEILYFDSSHATEPSWVRYWSYYPSYQIFEFANILSIESKFPGVAPPGDLKKKIISVSKSGSIFFTGQYDSCGYSVECVKPCPPNTLDCGDCCLNCQSFFNQLSALRAQIWRIK